MIRKRNARRPFNRVEAFSKRRLGARRPVSLYVTARAPGANHPDVVGARLFALPRGMGSPPSDPDHAIMIRKRNVRCPSRPRISVFKAPLGRPALRFACASRSGVRRNHRLSLVRAQQGEPAFSDKKAVANRKSEIYANLVLFCLKHCISTSILRFYAKIKLDKNIQI